jgi:Ala-tRNA(Pro) deacylase
MNVFETIKQSLDKEGVEHTLSEHEPVRTSEDAARVRGISLNTGAKSMVLKTKDGFSLFVLPADKRIDWKKARTLLGVKDVRFATEEEAETITHVKMGAVPPFGNLLELTTYFDEKLLENEFLNFNPGSTTHTVNMKSKDLVELVKPQLVSIIQND